MRVGDYVRVIATGEVGKVVAVGYTDNVTVRVREWLLAYHVNELQVLTR